LLATRRGPRADCLVGADLLFAVLARLGIGAPQSIAIIKRQLALKLYEVQPLTKPSFTF
jgi:hypothetical protein